jgi:hypothetical protein
MVAVADDILQRRQAFDDAELRGDADRLDALLGKREWIDRHHDFRYLSLETTEPDARHHGPTAIVRCAQRGRAS